MATHNKLKQVTCSRQARAFQSLGEAASSQAAGVCSHGGLIMKRRGWSNL